MRNKLLISMLLVAASCYAVDLPVVADVHAGPSTAQAGALPNLLVGGGNKALLRFDMGVLPAGLRSEQVVKATLVFHVSRILVAGPLQVSMLYGPFEEMTVTAATARSARQASARTTASLAAAIKSAAARASASPASVARSSARRTCRRSAATFRTHRAWRCRP